jgi:hypothetical protein
MSRKLFKILSNLIIAIVGIIAALLLLEIGARFLATPFDGSSNAADTFSNQTGWRGKPYYTTTVATGEYVHDLALNSVGMHDTEHDRAKPDNTYRILMLGDSFVQAVQVREAKTAQQVLEDLLNGQADSQNFELISAGVGGWGTGQQLLYYRNEGRYYQPDLVLLMFFLGNDVKDNLPGRGVTVEGLNHYTPYFVLNGNELDIEPWLYAPGLEPAVGSSFSGQKALNNILGRLHQESRLYAQLEPLVAAEPIKASMLDFYIGRNELFDYALELTFALVKQMRDEVERDGAEFAVVLISPIDLIEFSRLSEAELEEIYQRIPEMRRAEDMPPPNQQFAERFVSEGIKVLDLYPIFFQQIDKTGESPYFEGDKHWNTTGNRLAGEAIFNWLQATTE